jgi:hypothetical protein
MRQVQADPLMKDETRAGPKWSQKQRKISLPDQKHPQHQNCVWSAGSSATIWTSI